MSLPKYRLKNENLYWMLKSMVSILPKKQFNFLSCWYEICGQENKEFGFPGEHGLKDQMNTAFKFLKKLDNQWNYMIQNNITHQDENFTEFFYKQAIKEGVLLPDDFINKIHELLILREGL